MADLNGLRIAEQKAHRPRRDAQGRGHHGRHERRAGEDRPGRRRRVRHGARARALRYPPGRRGSAHVAGEEDPGDPEGRDDPGDGEGADRHFVEAQILEALAVDYIDESEVLTPADEHFHIDKFAFRVPFVCGCRDLGEALRRIGEGAAMIRTKARPARATSSRPPPHARRHLRRSAPDHARPRGADDRGQEPRRSVRPRALGGEGGKLPVPNFSAAGSRRPPTPRS